VPGEEIAVGNGPPRLHPRKASCVLRTGVPALLVAALAGGAVVLALGGQYVLGACLAGGCILVGMWGVGLAQACGAYIECGEHALRFVYRGRPFFGRVPMTVKEVPYDEIEDVEVMKLGRGGELRFVVAVGLVRRGGRRIALFTCLGWSGLASFVSELEKRRPGRARG
jgi:hypothetical protein